MHHECMHVLLYIGCCSQGFTDNKMFQFRAKSSEMKSSAKAQVIIIIGMQWWEIFQGGSLLMMIFHMICSTYGFRRMCVNFVHLYTSLKWNEARLSECIPHAVCIHDVLCTNIHEERDMTSKDCNSAIQKILNTIKPATVKILSGPCD